MASEDIGLRRGLKGARGAISPRTEFRTSFTSPEGMGPTRVFMGRVVNVDLVNYTVDVRSQFDQISLLNIPVSSMYQHPNRGDGFSAVPEVGSKCVVCWPGDSSPPFVLAFVMPHETLPLSGEADEAPAGTESRSSSNQAPTSASYAGGRPRAKPGDMMIRGRDGNFIVLHRGGVLQIGANELAQRVYIPLNNLVMDFAENYTLHNAGGSINWGIQEGEGETTNPTEFKQTWRVYANDKYADLRLAVGRVHDPVPETDKDAIVDEARVELGSTEPIVYELTLTRNGFKAEDGSLLPATGNLVKMRFVFDRAGNTFARFDGNVGVLCKKKLRVRVKEEFEVFADNSFSLTVDGGARVTVSGNFEITSDILRINGGDKPAAHVGSLVQVNLPPTLLMVAPTPTGFAPIATVPTMLTATGVVVTGRGNVLI